MAKKLTDKQEQFCQEYLIDLNATQAAIRAGYSEKTAEQQGSRLLSNVKVQEYITELKQKRAERVEITQDEVLKEYAKLAFFDVRKLYNDDGKLKPLSELDDDTAGAVVGLEVEEVYEGYGEDRKHVGQARKIKIADKKGSLDSVARHLGMFDKDSLNVKVNSVDAFLQKIGAKDEE